MCFLKLCILNGGDVTSKGAKIGSWWDLKKANSFMYKAQIHST